MPEMASKLEQPTPRGQAVLLPRVGFAVLEKWQFSIPGSTPDIVTSSQAEKLALKYDMFSQYQKINGAARPVRLQ